MACKTVLTANVSGTIDLKDGGKEPEAYKITVVFSDGTKTVLRKKYEEFVDLQVKVYELLKKKGGYSRKTSRTLVSSLPENNSALSRILFKDDNLKKMGRIDEFMKELLTLPTSVRDSEAIITFFGSLEQQGKEDRSREEELKKVTKVAEILSGRDPLRNLPNQSPVAKRKSTQNATWMPEDLSMLSDEARAHLYQKLNRLGERRPSKDVPELPLSKKRADSVDDAVLAKSKGSPRPGLTRRPISVPVGLASMVRESDEMKENRPSTPKLLRGKVPSLQTLNELNLQHSGSESSISALTDTSAIDSEFSEVEEPRSRKTSTQSSVRSTYGRTNPSKIKYVATSTFVAEETGEVSLEEGEEIEVVQKESSGWWYVKNDFVEGWAPEAFLAPSQGSRSSSPESQVPSQSLDSQDQTSKVRPRMESLSERPDVKEEEKVTPQAKVKSLERHEERGSQKKKLEMNRRPKFLTIEGIQKRKNPDKNYVYILKVVWSDGNINIVYRTCSDFFFLQENLRKECPSAIGKEIPALKGRKFTENCQFCFKDGTCKRQKFMNQFCHELVNAPDHISTSKVVMDFCRSRPSDVLPHGEVGKKDAKSTSNDDENVQISGPVVFEQFEVICDYKKKNKNDISLTAGDVVDVIEKNDYGWWLVDRDGELGWAPASHLEPTDDGAEVTSAKHFAPGKEEIYVSIKRYQATAADELSFDADVMLKVVEKTLDGWWLVRYQGDEGWAPAMHLKRVNSDDSMNAEDSTLDQLNIVSNDDESTNDEGPRIPRGAPTRRSQVQKTGRIRQKKNSHDLNGVPEEDNSAEIATEEKPSLPAQVNTPPLTRRILGKNLSLSRLPSRPHSGELPHGDVARQFSISSSGYESSPTGSLTSLASDVFPEDTSLPRGGVKRCATLPQFDHIQAQIMPTTQNSPEIPRSRSVTSMAQYKKELELSLNGIQSNVRKPSSGRSSPVSTPRKISASNRLSPLATSPSRTREFGAASPQRLSPRDSLSTVDDDDYQSSNSERNNGDQRESKMYKAIYTYIAQEDGEVSLIEGDDVEVIQTSENGWWLVRTSEELGWGPSNFLQLTAY